MLARTMVWGLVCAAALAGCNDKARRAPGAAEGKDGKDGKDARGSVAAAASAATPTSGRAAGAASAASAAGAAGAAGAARAANGAAPSASAAGAASAAEAASKVAGAKGASAANQAAAATVPPTADGKAPAAGDKPAAAAAGEHPLLAAKDLDDVQALFPERQRPGVALPEGMQKQIRYKLRDVSKAPIALRDAIYLPREDGSAEVVAIYELSVYEDCMRQGGSRKEARARCLPELETVMHADGESESVRLNRGCRSYGVVHASFAAAKTPGKAGEGGALRVAHLPLPQAECELSSLEQFFLDDVDRDGRRELVLDAVAAREVIEDQRRGQSVTVQEERLLWVLELGEEMTEQLHLSVAKSSAGEQRTFWVDLNRDKRPDLVQIAECVSDPYNEDMDSCDEKLLARTWYLYDRELDRWVDDETNRVPAKAAAPPPAGQPAADDTGAVQ